MEFLILVLCIIWVLVGIMFLATGVLSMWWMVKSFNWFNYLTEDVKSESEE